MQGNTNGTPTGNGATPSTSQIPVKEEFDRTQLELDQLEEEFEIGDLIAAYTKDEADYAWSHIRLAELFKLAFNRLFCYHFDKGCWLYFNGNRWLKSTGIHEEYIQRLLKHIDINKREAGSDVSQVEKLARSRLVKTIDHFDKDPYQFGSATRLVTLSGKNIGKGYDDPVLEYKHYISMHTPADVDNSVNYLEGSEWLKFLEATFPDRDIRDWLQQLFGQAMIGKQDEHLFIYFHGEAGTGKTTFIEAILHALGDYATTLPEEYLIEPKYSLPHSTGLADLVGKRVVFADEIPQGSKWNIPLIKKYTGGGTQKARFMRMDYFTFKPVFTMFAAGNQLPAIKFETAMEQRLRVVNFNQIPKEYDKRLPDKLKEEAGKILRWIVEGANLYRHTYDNKTSANRNSLWIPEQIQKDTQAYLRSDEHKFNALVGDDKVFIPDPKGRIPTMVAVELANEAMPKDEWTYYNLRDLLKEQGGIGKKRINNRMHFIGIRVNPT